MLALVDVEERIPANHPLRRIKTIADRVLASMSPTFDAMYAEGGRPSIPPERLLKAGVLMALYTVRSERAFCEELEYNLLYRWFLDLDLIEPGFDASTFSKNRERLLTHDVARIVFDAVVAEADREHLLSTDHFSVDGTMIDAAASMKSVRKRDGDPMPPPDDPGNPEVSFRNERRTNATHANTTDPEARLYRKGKGQQASRLTFLGHTLMENRHGLLVDITVTAATGTAERDAALAMVDRMRDRGRLPVSVGADKGYDTHGFVAALTERGIQPHIMQNAYDTPKARRTSAVSDDVATSPGYAISQRKRKLIEEGFGWMKTIGGLRRTQYRGIARTQMSAYLTATAYTLLRISRLFPTGA
ncbi:MAG: IS5 family transposase [Thermomicrobiales bacterium]